MGPTKNGKQVRPPGGGGVLACMSYIGMCGPKGYGNFSTVLVINRVSILADFSHFGHK